MSIVNQSFLANKINQVSKLKGTFKLRSGVKSNEYFDKYQFESDPQLLMEICKGMVDLIPDNTDYLAAMEMGGIPIATMLSYWTGIPLVFVRKEAKGYGTNKIVEGPSVEGKRLCIIEDVITSGGQVVKSVVQMRKELGAIVEMVICVIDRQEGGRENLLQCGLYFQPLFTKEDLSK